MKLYDFFDLADEFFDTAIEMADEVLGDVEDILDSRREDLEQKVSKEQGTSTLERHTNFEPKIEYGDLGTYLTYEMPEGIPEDAIDIDYKKGILTVKMEYIDEQENSVTKTTIISSRTVGEFDISQISASYEDNRLMIKMPHSKIRTGTKINID